MFRKTGILSLSISIFFVSRALAVDWTYTPLGGEADGTHGRIRRRGEPVERKRL